MQRRQLSAKRCFSSQPNTAFARRSRCIRSPWTVSTMLSTKCRRARCVIALCSVENSNRNCEEMSRSGRFRVILGCQLLTLCSLQSFQPLFPESFQFRKNSFHNFVENCTMRAAGHPNLFATLHSLLLLKTGTTLTRATTASWTGASY